MAEIITCPACRRKLQVPEAYAGQSVQCPECMHLFVADPHAAEIQSTPPPLVPSASGGSKTDDRPRRRDSSDDDDDEYRHLIPIRRSGMPHRGGMILTLGIVALVLLPCTTIICGPMAWVMGNNDIAEIRAGRMDESGEGMTQAGRILGMISTLLMVLLFAFYCLIFGVMIISG